MQKEIGSNFWIRPDEINDVSSQMDLEKIGIHGNDTVLLSTGRSAELLILETIEERNENLRKVALIPPFTCETVLRPFVQKGYEIHTYQIDENLITRPKLLKHDIEKFCPKIVLFHRYFGFDTFAECVEVVQEARRKGIIFIEDRTQNLYSTHTCIDVDYTIGSLRKWLGIPDGAFAVCHNGNFNEKPTEYNIALQETKVEAALEKYRYMEMDEGCKEIFLQKYREAENILAKAEKKYSMSPISSTMQHALDVQSMKIKRRENYRFIYEALCGLKDVRNITPELGKADVPLYYVMWVNDRSALQTWLREHDIYAPVVWPKSDIEVDICEEAEEIYRHVLCLPVDQRYDLDDMERMAECIKNWR